MTLYNVKALILLAAVFMAAGFGMMALYSALTARVIIIVVVAVIIILNRKRIIPKVKTYIALFK